MNINHDELRSLMKVLGITKASEMNCEEFMTQLPNYLEKLRALAVPKAEEYRDFLAHLNFCPECAEEFEALQIVLGDLPE